MDVFIELLVKKKRTVQDIILVFVTVFLGVSLVGVIGFFGMFLPYMGAIIALIIAAIVYGTYILTTSINLEYEYIFTNGYVDIDKIINVRKRKRIATFDIREIELFSNAQNPEFEKYMQSKEIKKLYACRDKKEKDLHFTIFTMNSAKTMLLFNPNEKMINEFKRINPQRVNLNE